MNISAKITLAIATACTLLGFSSCDTDDNNEVTTTQKLTSCYAMVTDTQTDNVSYCTDMTLQLDLDWTNATAVVAISGLKTPAVVPTVTISQLPWRVNSDAWSSITVASATASASNGFNQYAISNLDLRWLDRLGLATALAVPGYYQPGTVFSFTIDGRYKVVGSRTPFLLFGETKSVDPEGNAFENINTYYTVIPDFTNMTATIGITKAQFVQGMPATNMQFTAVPMTVASDGTITLAADNLIPQTADKTPQPDFPISELKGTLNPAKGLELSFKCNVRLRAMYTVTASVNYLDFTKLTD